MRHLGLAVAFFGFGAACSKATPAPAPAPSPAQAPARTVVQVETVTVASRDPNLERDLQQAQLRLLEQDAQLEDLRNRLEAARQEVVRALAKLSSSASRAEAASAMAEAEVAVQSLERSGASGDELARARRALANVTEEFNQGNFGGVLYLANDLKQTAGQFGRLGGGSEARPGEEAFRLPLALETTSRSNVRDGPGTNFKVLFTLEQGTALTGVSHLEAWIKVTDAEGRTGWIFQTLVARR